MTGTVERLLTEHLDTWTAAVETKSAAGRGSSKKLKLVGIAKLWELILELAVRGQLVPQNESDEPASVLLERIAVERERLIEGGSFKKQKILPDLLEEDKNFLLPTGWEFIRLNDVIDRISNGFSGKQNKEGNGYPVTRIETISKSKIDLDKLGYTSLIPDEKLDYYLLRGGDILLSHINSDYHVGKTALVPNGVKIYHGVNLLLLRVSTLISSRYVDLCLNQLRLSGYFISISQHAIGQSSINQAKVIPIPIALPPFSEQNRIVAKVDELMALCDALEQEQESSIAAHGLLVENLLAALTNAAGQGEFKQAWARVAAHFDTLFTTEQSVEQLKQTILQLAVMGKLVEQDPADEPAEVLLERIAAEKLRLVEEKVIKKHKALPEISGKEKRFKLPEKWEWCFLTDVLALVTDGDHQAPPKASDGVPFLVIGNLNTDTINFSGCRFVPQEYYDSLDWSRKPQKGDLLYTVTGSYGIPIEVNSDEPFCVQRHVAILKSTESSPCDYLSLLLKSKYAFEYASSVATGIAQKTVPLTGLRKLPVALPPLKEQQRIAKKVAELMGVCDQLKLNISVSSINQLRLANALTEQAVS